MDPYGPNPRGGRRRRILAARALASLLVVVLAVFLLRPGTGRASPPMGMISEIHATFIQSEFATHYTVNVESGFGPSTVTWSLQLTCVDSGCPDSTGTLAAPRPDVDPGCDNNGVGTKSAYQTLLPGSGTSEFVWHHPSAVQDPTGTYHCDHAKEGPRGHQGLITVEVSDTHTICEATYKGTNSSTATSIGDGTASMPVCTTNVAPTADFNYMLQQGADGHVKAFFDGRLSSDPDDVIVTYRWDFGDGTTATGSQTAHIYDRPGFYQVVLVVTDDRGARGYISAVVKIERPAGANPRPPTGSALGMTAEEKHDLVVAGVVTTAGGVAVLIGSIAADLTGVGAPIGAAMAGVSAGLATSGVGFVALGVDPSDSNFHAIVKPRFTRVLNATAGRGFSRTAANAVNALASNTSRVAGYLRAMVTSLNRASGALAAHDPGAATAQVDAAAGFATRAATALDRQPTLGMRAVPALAASRFPDNISASEVARARQQVRAHGLPALLQRILVRLGVSARDRRALRDAIADRKPRAVHVLSALTSAKLTQSERKAAAALRRFAATWSR